VVTPASDDERTQLETFVAQGPEVTGEPVERAWVDQGYTGQEGADTAAAQGIQWEVVRRVRWLITIG